IFAIQFKDPDDVVLAKVFLQEYADARRTMSNAPSVTYSQREPPLELRGVRNLRVSDSQGFVSFGTHTFFFFEALFFLLISLPPPFIVLFQPHMAPAKREKTIDNI